MSPQAWATVTIQQLARRYLDKRVYHFYKTLIQCQTKGDPVELLKSINPSEAGYMDASSGAHLRFRLGGYTYPPTIYYKIFLHTAICDINMFSPKAYHARPKDDGTKTVKSKIRVGKKTFTTIQSQKESKHWYQRTDNNGWRPITAKTLVEANEDPVQIFTAKKPVVSRPSKLIRHQDREKQRVMKKRASLQKMYKYVILCLYFFLVKYASEGMSQSKQEDDLDQLLEVTL